LSDFYDYLRINKLSKKLNLSSAQKHGEFMQDFIKKIVTGFTFLILVTAILSINATAATFTVLTTSNAGAGSLRQAVIDANSAAGADTIVFDPAVFGTPQTITLSSTISVSSGAGNSLTITGPGANLLTISGNNAVRIFDVITNATASISRITFTQAVTGAIISDGNLTVTDSTFNANTQNGGGSQGGGAIGSGSGSTGLTVTTCTFTNNTNTSAETAATGGGAIFINGGVSTISNSTFTSNMTTNGAGGGAVNVNGGTVTITGSTFTLNSTTFDGQNSSGGAINVAGLAQVSIISSTILGNSTVRNGGGINFLSNSTGNLTITDSTIANNLANSDNNTIGNGGGLFLAGTLPVTITRSTINGNTSRTGSAATGRGGGIDVSTPLTLTNSTVSGNSARTNGGGIYTSGDGAADVVTIESSTIANNTATVDGGGIYRAAIAPNPANLHNTIVANNIAGGVGTDIFGSVVSQGYNLIENVTGSTITGSLVGNITGQDPILLALTNNGGSTSTHALGTGSPAIDTGDTASFQAVDQRNVTRPLDGNPGNLIAQPDIGSYELAAPTAADASISGRVFGENGRGLARARVVLAETNGNFRYTTTNPFGYYRFTEVESGQVYVVNVASKKYLFSPQAITVNESLEGIDFFPNQQKR
jgi:predicted outer membrane repeat protein